MNKELCSILTNKLNKPLIKIAKHSSNTARSVSEENIYTPVLHFV